MPAKRAIYQDRAAGPGPGKFDALLASREAHEEVLLGSIEREKLARTQRVPRPSILARIRARWPRRR